MLPTLKLIFKNGTSFLWPLRLHSLCTPPIKKIWWHYEGAGELKILEVREDEQLIGLLPLFQTEIAGKQVLRIIGAVDLSDYLGAVVKDSDQKRVYEAFVDQLKKMSWDELRLESLHHQSAMLSQFTSLLPTEWHAEKVQQDVCPVIALPKTFDEYLESLDAKQRKHFRRLRRDMGIEDEITYQCETSPDAVKKMMPKFIELHKLSSREKESFWTPNREALLTEAMTALAQDGLVRLNFFKRQPRSCSHLVAL